MALLLVAVCPLVQGRKDLHPARVTHVGDSEENIPHGKPLNLRNVIDSCFEEGIDNDSVVGLGFSVGVVGVVIISVDSDALENVDIFDEDLRVFILGEFDRLDVFSE